MKKICLSVLAMCCGLFAFAQGKLDVHALDLVRRYELLHSPKVRMLSAEETQKINAPQHVTALVTLADGVSIEELTESGAVILGQRANMVIATIPTKDLVAFSRMPQVKKVSVGGTATLKLDTGRKATGVTDIHNGIGLPQCFTGKGVVTGLMDSGLDPNHIAFLDDVGMSRTKRLWNFTSANSVISYETPSEIATFTTENNASTHGTHVLGIMAGGYTSNSYYGVATGSDIAISCGELLNTCILAGVENIIEYAASEGKPAVINLSLGISSGPHDGNDEFDLYLDELGKEAIICVAAGNEGELPIAVNKTFTASSTTLKTFAVENVSEQGIYGTYEFWSNSDKPFSFTPVVYDKSSGVILFSAPTLTNTSNPVYVSSKLYAADGDVTSPDFDKAFTGYFGYASEVDAINGRYTAYVFSNLTETVQNTDGKYMLGFIVEGEVGQRVDGYCDGSYTEFSDGGVAGWDDGMTDGSISNMACGDYVVAVGAFTSRINSKTVNGQTLYYPSLNAVEGGILPFSSYGQLYDGRILPHVCAPGLLVSSVSTPNVQYRLLHSLAKEEYMNAKVTANGRDNYWEMDLGTSMATPFVAGSIALWLEADPTLTVSQVKDIIAMTATKDLYVTGDAVPMRWGAGKFNALAGLKEVIVALGVEDVVVDKDNHFIVSQLSDTEIEAYVAGESQLQAELYNVSGQLVASSFAQDDTVVINAGNVAKGVYILTVKGAKSQYSTRVLLK